MFAQAVGNSDLEVGGNLDGLHCGFASNTEGKQFDLGHSGLTDQGGALCASEGNLWYRTLGKPVRRTHT
jgi:hypothetical protein